jgi:transcriptional regulator with XRE-family HTH domain
VNGADLGMSLRELRKTSGKEAKAVARSALMSASKLSKIENGRVTPTVVDVDRILNAIGVSDAVKAAYLEAARAGATEVMAWRLIRRMGYHRNQRDIQALDEQMRLMRLFQSALVPGLLQTPEYMRAVLRRHEPSEEELTRTAAVRLERQRVLYDTAKDLRFILTEPVLRWRILPAAMMAVQVDRIIAVSRLPNVDVRVVPLKAGQHDFASHSFIVRDDRLVTVETVHAHLTVTDPRDVERYVRKFEGFAAVSLSGDAMRELAATIRDEFLTERERDLPPNS